MKSFLNYDKKHTGQNGMNKKRDLRCLNYKFRMILKTLAMILRIQDIMWLLGLKKFKYI